MQVYSSLSGIPFYAPSAGFAPTNSADVSAIASAYQVVSATATQLYAGTAYVTSVNDAPLSASRAGAAANASLANSAWYDGTGRLISALPDNATVSAIASAYAESAASGKQDELTFSYDDDKISAINGSALAGQGGGGGSVASPSGTIIVTDGTAIEATNSAIGTAESFGVNNSGQANYTVYSNSYQYLGNSTTFKSKGIGLTYNSSTAARTAWVSANTTLGTLVSSFVLPASSISAGGLLSTSNIDSLWDSNLRVEGGSLTLSGSYPVLFVYPDVPYSAVKELAWKDDIPASISLGLTYNNYVSSLNNMPLSASYAGVANTVNTASYARYDINGRPLSSLITKSDIPPIVSPSGTITVTDFDIEATNSAVVTGAFPGYSLQTASYAGTTTGPGIGITVTLPLAHPNAELVVGLGYGYAGTASAVFDGHTSTAYAGNNYGPATATLKVPNATTARIYTDTYRSVDGVSASALYGTGVTGVGELAWASAIPTYSYDSEDKISAINGSAIAGGAGGGVDSATVSAIASSYAESAVSSKADSSALSSYVPYSSLEYNTASAISGINGSALAAGSTYSAGEGIDITDDVISVETPVDIVAGPGIVIDNPDGNTLRVSMASDYEVVLWENSSGTRTTSGSLSEPMSHFEYIEFYSINNDYQCLPAARYHVNSTFLSNISGQLGVSMGGVCFNNNGTPLIKAAQIKATDSSWSIATTVDYVLGNTSKTTDMNRCWPSRIVGIHRIQGGS